MSKSKKSDSDIDICSDDDKLSGDESEYQVTIDSDLSDDDAKALVEFNKFMMEKFGKPCIAYKAYEKRKKIGSSSSSKSKPKKVSVVEEKKKHHHHHHHHHDKKTK